jgi:hypothetical protein
MSRPCRAIKSLVASSLMGAAVLFSTRAPFALTGEIAGPPSIETGDVWVDRLSSGDQEYRVLSVTANGVLYTMWGAQERSDSQWNPIVTSSLTESKDPPLIYARPLSMFPFPLIPGKSWSDETRWQIPDLSWAGRSVLQGKVGEWEQVAVPAGIFHALRVDVTIRGIGRLGYNNTTYITYWYAPECNRFVKLHFGDENQGIVDAEMVSYKPARW